MIFYLNVDSQVENDKLLTRIFVEFERRGPRVHIRTMAVTGTAGLGNGRVSRVSFDSESPLFPLV